MKKVSILLLCFVMRSHAMNHDPELIVIDCTGMRIKASIREKVPHINPGICTRCGKKAINRCQKCRLTYYCNQECQKADWLAGHKQACSEIEKAQMGDIAHMRNAFSAYLKNGAKTGDKSLVKKAIAWHQRTLIRMRQDTACSNDASTDFGVDQVREDHIEEIKRISADNFRMKREVAIYSMEAIDGAIKWVEKRTLKNRLVPPYGIRCYGINSVLSDQMNAAEEFIPEREWQKKRMEVLNVYKQVKDK